MIVKVTVAGMTFLAALGATGLIQEGGRPVCNAHNRGALWPDRSAWGPCTEVELCTVRMRKYQWKSATIHVSQLSKDPKRTNSSRFGTDAGGRDGLASPRFSRSRFDARPSQSRY